MHLPVNRTANPACRTDLDSDSNVTDLIEETTIAHPMLKMLDYGCTLFFTLELIVRVIFAPAKLAFFRSFMNLIDILALLPLYAQIILELTEEYTINHCISNNKHVLETIFILRIIRIFRVFHLVKHYKALKILVHAIKASVQELLMLSIFLVIGELVISTVIIRIMHVLCKTKYASTI